MNVPPGKTERLREILASRGLGGVLLGRPANFAWFTGGADNRVDHSDPLGVAAVLLTPESEYVVTNNIEAERLRREQTPTLEVVEHPWHEDSATLIQDLTNGSALGADHPLENAADLSKDLAPLRYVLDEEEIARYRGVGRDASEALAEASSELHPQMTEHEAVALLGAACRKRGLFTPVAVAAGGTRASLYRHAIPQEDSTLGSRVVLGVCAERGGLYANLTRRVDFERPDPETARRSEACQNILMKMRGATKPGRTLAEVFEDCRAFYAEEGFPDEWRLHHQGGLTGYASREVVAGPESGLRVEVGQAYAWNPTITGAKAEETFILTGNEGGRASPITN